MGKLLSQKEIDAIRDQHYNWDKVFEENMEKENVTQQIEKVFLKGKAYPQNEYFFKKKHPHKWQWHQFVKKVFRFFGSNIKFVYPPDGPKITP
jgi:hypothetical protein